LLLLTISKKSTRVFGAVTQRKASLPDEAPSLWLKNSIYLLAKPDCLHIRFLLGPSRKENGYEIIELNIGDYVSPERSCRIEDIVNAIPHVLESTLDPVTNLLKVKAHRGMVTSNYVVKELRQCAIACHYALLPLSS
jgi:hypothetical protein